MEDKHEIAKSVLINIEEIFQSEKYDDVQLVISWNNQIIPYTVEHRIVSRILGYRVLKSDSIYRLKSDVYSDEVIFNWLKHTFDEKEQTHLRERISIRDVTAHFLKITSTFPRISSEDGQQILKEKGWIKDPPDKKQSGIGKKEKIKF